MLEGERGGGRERERTQHELFGPIFPFLTLKIVGFGVFGGPSAVVSQHGSGCHKHINKNRMLGLVSIGCFGDGLLKT